ncbi:flagellar biosynthetic protein FliO [Bartonella phoceensis]|uniref:flagellar biosynthetic protein FliO n=1 Tax=Bartonella phoceensis TaxID=270249 RepID=UPI001ABB246B|nr:flagellar biosynthetic protein FliO [Bartonella phoceensis]
MYIWLSNQIGKSAADITISFVFFIITLTAIATIILFLRRLKRGQFGINRKKRLSRLTLCDTIAVDRTRRLVLIRCDDKEHLLLIGGFTDVVVETNIGSTSIIQKRGTQPTLTTTKSNLTPDITEKRSLSVNTQGDTQGTNTALFINQHVEDSAITAEIEGRQEPSLFIPTPQK